MSFQLSDDWKESTIKRFQQQLLQWYDSAKRSLPWRENRDPYRIWVSEVMLQQTTVAAVEKHFPRFLHIFPSIESLARAEEQQVLHAWQGLGYYRRARHLHQAAKRIVAEHADAFPQDPHVWANLPGVGDYMLGAILSQAFDQRLPIVEANSLRVLCRCLGYEADPRSGVGKKWLWEAARQLLPLARCGDYNQALMELGAIICTATDPKCADCPVQSNCIAYRSRKTASIPAAKQSVAITELREVALIISHSEKILFCQRPADTRWADMWEFPHAEWHPNESIDRTAERLARELTGMKIRLGNELTTLCHTVTRYRIHLTAIEAEAIGGDVKSSFYSAWKWLELSDLKQHPSSTPQRKLVEALLKSGRSRRLF